MREFLRKFIDLREGEGVALAQAFFTLFGLIAGHTVLETARDTLFLTRLPVNRLTFVYALLAGLAIVGARTSTWLSRTFGRKNALMFTLLIAAYGTVLFQFGAHSRRLIFILYLWSGFLGTLMIVQFWMFAGQLLTGPQSKRLFSVIASGGVLGAIAGAGLAVLLLEFYGVSSLLLLGAGLFMVTALLLTTARTTDTPAPAQLEDPAQDVYDLTPKALLARYPYLGRLGLWVALSTACVLATDYLFKSVAAETHSGPGLGEFFAKYYAVLNILSLVVQIGIAPRVVQKQGVVVASVILPLLLVAGSTSLLVLGPVFALVLVTKGADGAFRHSLHRVSSELLWLPVPREVRDRGKGMIDGFVQRGTQALIAGLIFLMTTFGFASPRLLAALVLVLAVAWILVALGLRIHYFDLIRQALTRGNLEDPGMLRDLDINSVEAVLESLSSPDPARAIAAMDLLVERKRARFIVPLILNHESEEVLVRALRIFATAPVSDDWMTRAERLLSHESDKVRVAAIRALISRHKLEHAERGLQDPSPVVRAHAAFCLAHNTPDADPMADPVIRGLLELTGDEGKHVRLALLDAIRDYADVRWAGMVLELSTDEDYELVERAAGTMAVMRDPRFIPVLLQRLSMRNGRGAVREALVQLGEPALDVLQQALIDPATEPRVRLHIPRTISRFRTQRAADILMQNLTNEISGQVRYKILRGLGRLVAENKVRIDRAVIETEIRRNLIEYLRVMSIQLPLERDRHLQQNDVQDSAELVIGLLENKEQQALERAFRLLQIVHRRENIQGVHLALVSSDEGMRATAQDFIDVVTSPRSRSTDLELENRDLWRLAADDLTPEDRIERAADWIPDAPKTYEKSLSLLVQEADIHLAAMAAYHALEIGVDTLRDEVIEMYEKRPSLRVILQQATLIPRGTLAPLVPAIEGAGA